MKNTQLFKAIGEIPDSFVTEANTSSRAGRLLKTVSIAAAALLLGTAAIAAPIIFSHTSIDGTNIPDYYSAPSSDTLFADTGIKTEVPKKLGDYSFESGYINENKDYDENGNVISEYKSLAFKYSLEDDTVFVSIDASPNIEGFEGSAREDYLGCIIEYDSYQNKLVPGNYTLTEEDKHDKESGKYVFTYGASEMSVQEVKLLYWKDNGLTYNINASNSPLSKDELFEMAEEIIDFQR